MDDCSHQKEGEEPGDHRFIGHPEAVLVEPKGIVEPLSKVRLAPAGLLVEPAQILRGGLGLALWACREFSFVAETEDAVGEVPIISEAALAS